MERDNLLGNSDIEEGGYPTEWSENSGRRKRFNRATIFGTILLGVIAVLIGGFTYGQGEYFTEWREKSGIRKPFNRISIFWAILSGVIAVLIGGFTYGLGTVNLASSLFLGAFGGSALSSFANSFFNFYSETEKSDDIQIEKIHKKCFIATLVIGVFFTIAAVLIGALTFGIGAIPLGTFAAVTLVSAFASIAISSALSAYKFGRAFKSMHEENKQKNLANNRIELETNVEQKLKNVIDVGQKLKNVIDVGPKSKNVIDVKLKIEKVTKEEQNQGEKPNNEGEKGDELNISDSK